MYPRILSAPTNQSFFLFGPRGTGKTAWLHATLPDALVFDLLDDRLYSRLLASPTLLSDWIPASHKDWVVLDEVQRVPSLLNEVHRLIEGRGLRFALTGSSARKLRGRGVNLLAGRALTRRMHPLTATELGSDFDLTRALRFGLLPFACTTSTPAEYLSSYIATYLREEVQQEGLTRNLASFARFLEAASFSQGSLLNIAGVARDCAVHRKVVEDYFQILEDLLIAVRIPVFTRRAQRDIVSHNRFYYFDAGVFRTIRPTGPLDSREEIDGPVLETLVLSHLRAWNDARALGYEISFWRTRRGDEVDFVLYGERGLLAIEVKRSSHVRAEDLRGLRTFREDYPEARALLLYPGNRRWHEGGVDIIPIVPALEEMETLLNGR